MLRALWLAAFILCPISDVSSKSNVNYPSRSFCTKYKDMPLKDIKQLGNEALFREQPDSAMMYYNLIFSRYNDKLPFDDIRAVAGAYVNSGYINAFYKNELAKAFADYQKAENIAADNGETSILPYIYLNKGAIYATYNDSVKTMNLYKQAFYSSIKEKDWDITITAFTNIMQLLDCNHQGRELQKILSRFEKLSLPSDLEMLAFTRTIAKAAGYVTAKRWDDAIKTVYAAEEQIDIKLQPERYRMACEQMIAQIYMRKHDYANAVPLYMEVLKGGRRDNAMDCISDGLTGLMRCYEAMGNTSEALRYKMEVSDLRDSLFNSHGYVQIRDMESEYAVSKIGAKVEQLEKEKRQQYFFLTILSVLVVFIIIMLFVYIRKNHIQKRLLRSLYEKNEELLSMEKQVESTEPQTVVPTTVTGPLKTDSEVQALLYKVQMVMKDITVISQSDFTIVSLAELIGSKDRYVSQAINAGLGKNFNTWLGELRIHEACRRLKNPVEYGNLTLEAIGQSLGFKSRSNFSSVFKKVTGMTPSEYLKMAREE